MSIRDTEVASGSIAPSANASTATVFSLGSDGSLIVPSSSDGRVAVYDEPNNLNVANTAPIDNAPYITCLIDPDTLRLSCSGPG